MNPKNIILTAIILISLFTVTLSVNATVELREDELLNPGTTPDSPFYFLKTWKESIQTFFTFGLENKARQYLRLAEVRLAEYQKMIDKGKTKIAEKTLAKYEKQLNRALDKAETMKQKGKDVKDISQKLEDKLVKHAEVLEKNLEKAPEAAKKGLGKAIESSGKAIEKITGKPKQGETAGWKTYRSEEWGYEIKYPLNLGFKPKVVTFEGKPVFLSLAEEADQTTLLSLEIIRKETLNCDNETTWLSHCDDICQREKAKEARKDIKINNYPAKFVSRLESSMRPPVVKRTYVCVKNDPNVLFDFTIDNTKERDKKYSSIFNQILSAFRFTK